jgi:hypothetical protein
MEIKLKNYNLLKKIEKFYNKTDGFIFDKMLTVFLCLVVFAVVQSCQTKKDLNSLEEKTVENLDNSPKGKK